MALVLAKNKKALWDHSLLEKYVAGVALKGHEVKAIKEGNVSFEGSFVQIIGSQPELINMYVGKYSKQAGEISPYETKRSRRLLLNRHEVLDVARQISEKGRTAVPLALILDHGLIKLEFAVVKGKKEFEKKQVAKERQIKKDLEVETKEFRRSYGR